MIITNVVLVSTHCCRIVFIFVDNFCRRHRVVDIVDKILFLKKDLFSTPNSRARTLCDASAVYDGVTDDQLALSEEGDEAVIDDLKGRDLKTKGIVLEN